MSEKKNKILLLVPLPPPIHGSNIINQYVINNNDLKRKYETLVIPLKYASSIEDIGKLRLLKIIKFVYFLFKLTNKLYYFRPDFVYFVPAMLGTSYFRDCIFVMIIKSFRKKIIFHLHMKGIKQRIKTSLMKKTYTWFFNNQFVILLSPLLYKDIQEVVDKKKIKYLPNGIDIEVNHISKNYGKPKKSLRVLFFSNLHPTKGAIDFINACRILKTSGFNYNASIAGNPSKQFNYLEFKKLITAYKLQKHIQYIGPKYGKEKSELFQKSDIFVFPTFYKKECFPLVILEAMAFGLPVISTFEGAIPEIIDNGITGFLVPQKSPFSIAQKIIFLILNEKKRICMGQEARKKYEKYYTIEKFNSNFLEIIDCIFNQKIP